MDKFEALRSNTRVLVTRRYGDISELMALLKRVGATALKLDVTQEASYVLAIHDTYLIFGRSRRQLGITTSGHYSFTLG